MGEPNILSGPSPIERQDIAIVLPPNLNGGEIKLRPSESIVFIGANGSGKSRLAGWLDQNNPSRAIYIPARRSIAMPNSYSIVSEEKEFVQIFAGSGLTTQSLEQMKNFRYQKADRAFVTDDFDHVLNILGGRHASAAIKFKQSFDPEKPPEEVPQSDLEKAIKIWSLCLPHLKLHSDKAPDILVERVGQDSGPFDPIYLSDGERAIFYLVAKAMLASKDGIVIVDEPEMYVHRAIRNRLWDLIESYRNDCVFVYFTHDVDFVATRTFARKFVVQSFAPTRGTTLTAGNWNFMEFTPDGSIPQESQLAILGSRQPVLLIEGDRSSLDIEIARAFYTDFYIESKGSCGEVIRSVAALNSNAQFHHKSMFGLIDRDHRSNDTCASLADRRVYVHRLKEIENLLVAEKVLHQLLINLGRENEFERNIEAVVSVLRKKLEGRVEQRAVDLTKSRLRDALAASIGDAYSADQLATALKGHDINALVEKLAGQLRSVLSKGTLDDILSFFSVRKDDFRGIVATQFGFRDWARYEATIMGWIKAPESVPGGAVRKAMKSYLPTIAVPE